MRTGEMIVETTVWFEQDQEHDVWQCGECGHLHKFEADGPEENSFDYCPYCGRMIREHVHL